MIGRVRTSPSRHTPQEVQPAKKLKIFVTDQQGKVFMQGFQTERPQLSTSEPFVNKTAYANDIASEQNIYGTNLTCIIDTGADVNLIGRKHLQEFALSNLPYEIRQAPAA